jgi:AraC-like DNA-binding protein
VVAFASRINPDCASLWQRVGLDPSVVTTQPDERYPVTKLMELLDAAVACTGDAQLGLHIAETASPRRFDLLNYIFTHSADVRESMRRAQRYLRLWNEGFDCKLEESGRTASLRFETRGFVADPRSEGLRQLFDLSTVTVVRNVRMNADPSFTPDEVHYFTEAHTSLREHQRYFGAALQFSQPVTQILFPARILELPMRAADTTLGEVLLRQAEELLARQPTASDSWTDRVRGLVYERFGREDTRLEALARQLSVSARSLQRRLSDEGTSLAAIEDEVRQALARRYVADPSLGLAEVAYLLNFSDLSGFYRAFRRWTGKTPVEFRRERGAPNPGPSP